MINVKALTYTVIVLTEKKLQLNITNAVQALGWEENENELATKITLEVFNAKHQGTPLSDLMKIGCIVAVKAKAGGKSGIVAYGKVVEAEVSTVSGKKLYKITAYDCLYDMQKSQDNVYFASGKSTKAIFTSIFKSWGIPVGSYKGPNVTHSKILYKNKSLGEICRGILDEAKKKKGGKGLIRSEKNKVSVLTVGSNAEAYIFTPKNTTTSKLKRSTVDMVTRVKIAGPAEEKENPKIEATVNGKTQYGIRQKIVTRSKSDSLSDAKKEANEILEEHGDVKDSRTVISPDVPFVRKGDSVYLNSIVKSAGYYVVKSVQHNASKRLMTMELEAKPQKPSYASSSSNSSKTTKYKVIARSGLNQRKTPNGTIMQTAPYGTIVQGDAIDGGWIHCLYNGQWGWMYSQYLQEQSSGSGSGSGKTTKYKVTARSGLNMRKTPNGTIITAAPYGATVEFDGKTQSGWYHCKYNGKWGYMYAQYLTKA